MNKNKILIGSDPEVFIKQNNTVVGSELLLTNDLEFDFGKIIKDGIQVEFNPKPANNVKEFKDNHVRCLNALYSIAEERGFEVTTAQVVDITQETMDMLSDNSKVFGCNPSYNAYGEVIKLPKDASKIMYRSGGGHIHISSEDETVKEFIINNREVIVRALDFTIGYPLLKFEKKEDVIRRRTYYGRAGEYRMPEYGLEYRTPSNVWLDKDLYEFVFNTVVETIDNLIENIHHYDNSGLAVKDKINNYD